MSEILLAQGLTTISVLCKPSQRAWAVEVDSEGIIAYLI